MKICPQCKSVFLEDYVFCMNDGTTLIDDDNNEQETVVREKISTPDPTSALSPDMLVICSSCSLANRTHSKFCKKCGTTLQPTFVAENPPIFQQEPIQSTDSPTVFFSPPSTSNSAVHSTNNGGNQQLKIIGGLICVLLVIVIGILALNSKGEESTANRNTHSSNDDSYVAVNSNESIPEATPEQTKEKIKHETIPKATPRKNGAITTTDVVARGSASPYASQVAIFYLNSKLKVLGSAKSETGTLWYRVRVVEYGCSRKVNRCGQDESWDAEEGWVYSENINFR